LWQAHNGAISMEAALQMIKAPQAAVLGKASPVRPPMMRAATAAPSPKAFVKGAGPPPPPRGGGGPKLVPPRLVAPPARSKAAGVPGKSFADGGSAKAFAVLPTDGGLVLAPPDEVEGMLRSDWALFLELASYSLEGHGNATIAFGIEEVAEAIAQAAVAVLFVPTSCGEGGEDAVRGVAMCGGRGYVVGSLHAMYEDVDDWGAAAILHQPLQAHDEEKSSVIAPPQEKRQRLDDGPLDAATSQGAPESQDIVLPVPAVTEKDVRHELKKLGLPEALADKECIPRATATVTKDYLPVLGPAAVFTAFHDAFNKCKGIAHRKAILYVVHDLFLGKRTQKAMTVPGRREACVQQFLIKIGAAVKSFKSDERQAYVKVAQAWEKSRVLLPDELQRVKDAWDMD